MTKTRMKDRVFEINTILNEAYRDKTKRLPLEKYIELRNERKQLREQLKQMP